MSTKEMTPEASSHEDSSPFTPVSANGKGSNSVKTKPKAKAGKTTTADDLVASSKTGPIMILCEIAWAQDKKVPVSLLGPSL